MKKRMVILGVVAVIVLLIIFQKGGASVSTLFDIGMMIVGLLAVIASYYIGIMVGKTLH